MNRHRETIIGVALGLATFLQGVMLLYLGQLNTRQCVQTLIMALACGVAIQQAWQHRSQLNHRVDMAIVMLAFGGLGMIIGWWIDFGCAPAPVWMRLGLPSPMPRHFSEKILSWMTGLMLATSIPPAVVLTRCARLARHNLRLFFSTHVIGNLAMVFGMILTNQLYGRALGRLVGSMVIGAHVAMVFGMVIGMVVGMWLGEAMLGLRPWLDSKVAIDPT